MMKLNFLPFPILRKEILQMRIVELQVQFGEYYKYSQGTYRMSDFPNLKQYLDSHAANIIIWTSSDNE